MRVIRKLAFLGATLWAASMIALAVRTSAVERRDVYYGDFGRFFYTTREAADGRSMYTAVPANLRAVAYANRQPTDLNPPHFHVLLLPLTAVPISIAWALWMVTGSAVLVWATAATSRRLAVRLRGELLYAVIVVLASSMAVVNWIFTGQLTMVLLAPMTLAWFAARDNRWTSAGSWMGLCWSVKPFLGLFGLYFLVTRRWSALFAGTVAMFAAFAIGIAIFGIEAHIGWLQHLRAVSWYAHPRNASLLGLTSKVLPYRPNSALLLWALGSLVLLGALAQSMWRSVRDADVDRVWLAVLVASLLISPLGWTYYTVWLFGPVAALAVQGRLSKAAIIGAVTLWVPWQVPEYHVEVPIIAGTVGSVYTWGLLVLFFASTKQARRTVPYHRHRTFHSLP